MRVRIGVTQVKDHCAEQMVLTWRNVSESASTRNSTHTFNIQVRRQVMQSNDARVGRHEDRTSTASPRLSDGGNSNIHHQ